MGRANGKTPSGRIPGGRSPDAPDPHRICWAGVGLIRGADRASQTAYLDNFIAFWYRMGYDFVRFERGMGIPDEQA